jgi:hypothetical protein
MSLLCKEKKNQYTNQLQIKLKLTEYKTAPNLDPTSTMTLSLALSANAT